MDERREYSLVERADKLYNRLIPEEQVTVRRILRRLVRYDEDMGLVSNPMHQREL